MANEVKFTEDELTKIQSVQDDYNEVSVKLGQLSVQEIILNQQIELIGKTKDALQNDYKKTQQTEKDLSDVLNKKYGTGTLDIKTGIFTPQK